MIFRLLYTALPLGTTGLRAVSDHFPPLGVASLVETRGNDMSVGVRARSIILAKRRWHKAPPLL